MKIKKIVVLTGAGVSAESGVNTFRDAGGLWEGYRVEDVATPQGFENNPELVLNFYNERRQQLSTVKPNKAHLLIAELQKDYEVVVITQNVDDLHERAGSKHIIHLHGELLKMREVDNDMVTYSCNHDIKVVEEVETADIVLVIGTSLQVYPAAGLMHYAPEGTPIYYIDPHPSIGSSGNITVIAEKASVGVEKVIDLIKERYKNE